MRCDTIFRFLDRFGVKNGPKRPKTSKTRQITVSRAKVPEMPEIAVLDPETAKNGSKPPSLRHQNPLSERKTQNQTKSRKMGAHKIQWNKKGRRTVSPILQNSVRKHSGEVGPLKSAEKQAKTGPKTAFWGRFRGFGPLGRGLGVQNREKSQKIKIASPQCPQGHRD